MKTHPIDIVFLCLLLPLSAAAQTNAPAAPSPSTSAAAPGTSQSNTSQPNATQPQSAPNATQASPGAGGSAASPSGGGASALPSVGSGGLNGGMSAPVSPAVPSLASPLPGLAPATVPPPAGDTLPAAPPVSLAPVTPGATPLALTPDEAVALAARRNLGLLAALRDVLAARSGVQSARPLSPPSFTIGPALETGGTTDGLLFLQPLEINGVRGARTRVARARLRLAQAQAVVQLQSLTYTTRFLFAELARAQAQLALQRSLLVTAQSFDQIARTQVALGARPAIEQLQTAIQVARARQLVAQSQGEAQAALAALNAYLGRAPLDPITTTQGLPPVTAASPPVDIAAAQNDALKGRGEIAVAEASQGIPTAQAALYRAQGRPDLAPDFRINQITPKYNEPGFGIVLTIPLDYGTRRNLIRQQDRIALADGDRLAGTEAQVRLDAEQAAVRLQAAQSVLAEYNAGLSADARQVLDAALYGFRSGATTIISVLAAQTTYRQVVSEEVDARASVAEARAALDRATGVVPPALLTELQQDFAARAVPGNKTLR